MVYERELSHLMDQLRSEANISVIDSVQTIASIASVKFLELDKERYSLPDELSLGAILKEGAFLAEKVKAVLNEIEAHVPFLKGVYELSDLFGRLSNNTLYHLLSRIHSFAFTKEQWKQWIESLFVYAGNMAGVEGVELITPAGVNELGIRLLNMEGGEFYDGVSGLSGTLCAASEYARRHHCEVALYGQEINQRAWALGKLRLLFHDRTDAHLAKGDTLTEPAFVEGNKLKKFDYIMMNFPFGMRINSYEQLMNDRYDRFVYGRLPRTSADMAFILHALSSLKENGKAVLVVTNGTLFRGGPEAVIRGHLLSADLIESVIALPSSLLDGAAIQINLLVLNKNKSAEREGNILFINAENYYGERRRGRRYLRQEDIDRIVAIYHEGLEIDEVSKFVSVREIEEANLLSNRYLQSSEWTIDPYGKVKFYPDHIKNLPCVQPLKRIGTFYRGINISAKDAEIENGPYKVIKLSDVQNGEVLIDQLASYEITNNAKIESYLVQEGDVIISVRGAGIKIAVIPPHEGDILISHNFIGIRPHRHVDPFYLKVFLESPVGQYLLLSKQAGTNVTILNMKDLENIPIPVRPFEEQKEIIMSYLEEQKHIQDMMKQLEKQRLESSLKLYEKMGIRSTFTLMQS